MIQALLLDLDGTLLDTSPTFTRVVNTLKLKRQEMPLSQATIQPYISFGTRVLLERCFQITPEHPLYEALKTDFLTLYAQTIAKDSVLFPGFDHLFPWWAQQNRKIGIVTNKFTALTEPLLEQLHLREKIQVLVCGDTLPKAKPHPEPIWHACERLGVDPQHTVYVGDAARDIEAGRAAGTKTIAALYGYLPNPNEPKSWGADASIHSVADLLTQLLAWDESLSLN